ISGRPAFAYVRISHNLRTMSGITGISIRGNTHQIVSRAFKATKMPSQNHLASIIVGSATVTGTDNAAHRRTYFHKGDGNPTTCSDIGPARTFPNYTGMESGAHGLPTVNIEFQSDVRNA